MTISAPARAPAHLISVALALALVVGSGTGCNDVTHFTTTYSGPIVGAPFVRVGFGQTDSLCLVLDASHLQSFPGTISSSNGRFLNTPLRQIPQVWHDPLSTLTFGEGRVQNLIYIATPLADADAFGDVTVVLSLMQSGMVEARIFRGAPTESGAGPDNLFGVFSLSRTTGPPGKCSF